MKNKNALRIIYVAAIVLFCAFSIAVAQNSNVNPESSTSTIFVCFPPGNNAIVGGSSVQGFEGCIEALDLQWGVSNNSSAVPGGGGGAGITSFDSLTFQKLADSASSGLFLATATGLHIPSVNITVASLSPGNNATATPVYEIEAGDVLVNLFSFAGKQGDLPTESVGLDFRTLSITANGATYCFDLATNTQC